MNSKQPKKNFQKQLPKQLNVKEENKDDEDTPDEIDQISDNDDVFNISNQALQKFYNKKSQQLKNMNYMIDNDYDDDRAYYNLMRNEEDENEDQDEDDDDDDDEDIDEYEFENDFEEDEMFPNESILNLLLQSQPLAPITSRKMRYILCPKYEIASCEMQGYRDNNEDQHIIHLSLFNDENISLFGVFDGHGGDLTSKFVANNIISLIEQGCNHQLSDDKEIIAVFEKLDDLFRQFEEANEINNFIEEENKINDNENKNNNRNTKGNKKMKQKNANLNNNNNSTKITQKKKQTNSKFNKEIDTVDEIDIENEDEDENDEIFETLKPNEKGLVGSTVIICIVKSINERESEIISINLGDSRAMLLKSSNYVTMNKNKNTNNSNNNNKSNKDETKDFISLSSDHNPTNPIEEQRIVKAGGFVKFERVDGDLALSRAIGDNQYKANKKIHKNRQKVISIPDITRTIAKKEDILLLFCDGIVEQTDNEQISDVAKKLICDQIKNNNDKNHKTQKIIDMLKISEKEIMENKDKYPMIPKNCKELNGLLKIVYDIVEHSLTTGSQDNMTVIAITFGHLPWTHENNQNKDLLIWSPSPYHSIVSPQHFHNDASFQKKKKKFIKLYLNDCNRHGWKNDDILRKIICANDIIHNENELSQLYLSLNSENCENIFAINNEIDTNNQNDTNNNTNENKNAKKRVEINVGSSKSKKRRLNQE